jgi:hypothetical protein
MKAIWACGVMAALGAVGCASTGSLSERGEADFSSRSHRAAPSVRVGDARMVGARINPLVPLHLASNGSEVSVTFARPGRMGTVAKLDASSLAPLSTDPSHSEEKPSAPSNEPGRITLDQGRFVVIFVRGSTEWGHRALAQTFDANGTPRGAPVVISPPDLDVVGVPRAVTTDGRHVVATFAAAKDNSFDVFAVSIDDAVQASDSDAVALLR